MTLREKVAALAASKNLKQRVRTGVTLVLLAIATAIFFEAWPLRIALSGCLCIAALEIYAARVYCLLRESHSAFTDFAEYLILGVAVVFLLLSVPSLPHITLFALIAYGHDVAAFFVGRLFGGKIVDGQFTKGKLFATQPFPKLSPKKTGEGCLGGIILSTALAFTFIFATRAWFGVEFTAAEFVLAGIGGIIALLGDLLGSLAKRRLGLADSGDVLQSIRPFGIIERLLDGHGGYLDRFDSLSLVISVAAVLHWTLH